MAVAEFGGCAEEETGFAEAAGGEEGESFGEGEVEVVDEELLREGEGVEVDSGSKVGRGLKRCEGVRSGRRKCRGIGGSGRGRRYAARGGGLELGGGGAHQGGFAGA